MPELPEVETVIRDLRPALVGRTITAVATTHPGILRHPTRELFHAALPGHRVTAVERRGKYIVCHLHGELELIFHLGMTGHITVGRAARPAVPHVHLRARLDGGDELRVDDARRFGRILFGNAASLAGARAMPRLGLEPLSGDLTAEWLGSLFRSTTRTVKAVLLDQTAIAGLGNIYADESCHRAGIRPSRRAHGLSRAEREALSAAIPAVLRAAIRDRGTTFDDFRDLGSERGRHQHRLLVYGRGGRPCRRCGALLRRTVVAGRTTVHCPRCQS